MKKYLGIILIFGLLFSVMLFGFLFIKNLWGDYIIHPVSDEITKVNPDNSTNAEISKAVVWFDNWTFPFDYFFLFMWLGLLGGLVYLATQSVKLPAYDFTSFLFFGVLIIMFVFDYINQLTQWFYINFIGNVFTSDLIYFPIYNFYLQNHVSIVFVTILSLLLINQLLGKEPTTTGGGI